MSKPLLPSVSRSILVPGTWAVLGCRNGDQLSNAGVEYVEYLNIFDPGDWDELFEDYPRVYLRVAQVLYTHMKKEGGLDTTKCATDVSIRTAYNPPPISTGKTQATGNVKHSFLTNMGISRQVTVAK